MEREYCLTYSVLYDADSTVHVAYGKAILTAKDFTEAGQKAMDYANKIRKDPNVISVIGKSLSLERGEKHGSTYSGDW